MRPVIIIGAGGHAAELDEYIAYANQISGRVDLEVVGFLDDCAASYSQYRFSAPLLGSVQDHQVRTDCEYLMGIANLQFRKQLIEEYVGRNARFAGLTHPTAYVSPTSLIGDGVVLGPMVNIGPNVVVGDYTLVNSRCSFGHDTKVGRFNFISPNVCFSGFTQVGDNNLFGINSATIPGVKVGNNNKIMAGMVLDKNVGDDEVVFFRFKEKVIAVPK